ncbi:MAG: DNA replication/repair protein RecF [Bacilli bacterium]|nr:DNA replication/repair protein RecF [Bacilli bacterium]
MQVLKLRLINFRNFIFEDFEFSKYKNIIIGNNGMGKTNIIEAIYFLALTKSFRTTEETSLININNEFAVIKGEFKTNTTNEYKIIIEKPGKKVFINNQHIKRLSDYISKINIILFNKEDLKLIKDSPSTHRKLINMELSQLNNEYLKILSNYNKILKHRNTYLKSMQINNIIKKDYLFILTDKLIDLGIKIYNWRKDYIDEINTTLNKNFNKITKKDGIFLKYNSDYNNLTKEKLLKKYEKDFQRDLNYGKTNFGIHLDDFIFYYKKRLAKDYLSEGEQKNVVISFKLAEVNIFYKKTKTMPILILDDLFSELDTIKINRIINFFKKNIQIFITTTDLNNIDKKILSNSKVFRIKGKTIEVKEYD